METFVPLISGAQTGPLGFAHLPRLWLKLRAFASGVLAEGYRHGSGGNDEQLLTALGIEPQTMIGFVERESPDYLTCEAWVRANATGDLSPDAARKFTQFCTTFVMLDPRRSEWTLRFGLTPGTYTYG
ncbi:MAG TPA: DUF5069 domain-containing protein, partial [Vicinamibacterales bacterium]|nr:DUF5069 domain-containing protein [Vicinamibacterales bacterium]